MILLGRIDTSPKLTRISVPKMKFIRKRRRSLVRIIASFVPNFLWGFFLPVPPRMYISASVMERISSLKQSNFQSDDDSFCDFRSHINNTKDPKILYSTPLKNESKENSRIKELQKELNEIKKQIAKLMEHQCDQLQCSGYGTLSNRSEPLQKTVAPPLPPPLPPPPPPLPNFCTSVVTTPIKSETKKKNSLPVMPKGLPSGKELLRDLKKVQLRKVEKSPGGGPLKKPEKIKDPGDFLEAVLKKRFGLVQNSPESSMESLSFENNDSFTSTTYNGILKITVT